MVKILAYARQIEWLNFLLRQKEVVLCARHDDALCIQILWQVFDTVKNNVVAVRQNNVGGFARQLKHKVHVLFVAKVVADSQCKVQHALVWHLCNTCDGGICDVFAQQHAKSWGNLGVVRWHTCDMYAIYASICGNKQLVRCFVENKQHNFVTLWLVDFGNFSTHKQRLEFFRQHRQTQCIKSHSVVPRTYLTSFCNILQVVWQSRCNLLLI